MRKLLSIILLSLVLCAAIHAELFIDEDWGFSLDLPAGYVIADQDAAGLSALFTHSKIPVTVVSKVYTAGQAASAEDALRATMRKLPNRYFDISTVPYRRDTAAIACFNMTLDVDNRKQDMEGWAAAAPLIQKGGQVVVIAYTQASDDSNRQRGGNTDGNADIYQQVIISVLNSLATDTGSKREAGIMTRFAYPAMDAQDVTLNIGGHTITTHIDASDTDASAFVIGSEYAVLSLYAQSDLYQEAWRRYYRTIFRDSTGRIAVAASDIYQALRGDAISSGNEGYYLASALLGWAQSMPYARGGNSADFTPLTAAMLGVGCDCDTRSLLICTLLDCMNVRCALFVSPVYSHAVFGADVAAIDPKQNARLNCGGTEYLLGETTAHGVPLGMIAAEHRDSTKWMGVSLGIGE